MQALAPTDNDYWKHIVKANNSFGVDFLKTIALAKPLDNIFISPTSIFLLTCMLYNGAAGNTFAQLSTALKLPTPQEINPWNRRLINHLASTNFGHDLYLASALWFGSGILCHDQFVNNCIESYSASLYSVDFRTPEAVEQINYWASNATKEKITKVTDALDPEASLVITNAIYFFALWKEQFSKNDTKVEPFQLVGGGQVEVPMMSRVGELEYFESESFQVAKLPYLQSPFFMQVILPKPGFHFGHCLNPLGQPTMPMIPVGIDLKFPRFNLEFELDLLPYLNKLGVTDTTDWSLICPGLTLSQVLHKTKLTVDEEGTEAAAVTVATQSWGSAPPRNIVMHVNRPFLFNIVDGGTGQILFSGAVVSPSL